MDRIEIETTDLTKRDAVVLDMALALGDAKLVEMGINAHVIADQSYNCSDGIVLDTFGFEGELNFTTHPGGLTIFAANSSAVERTVFEQLAIVRASAQGAS